MPKIKTRQSVAKRLRVTGAGKVVARKMSAQHRARFKSTRSKANAAQSFEISSAVVKKMRRVGTI